MDNTFYRQFEDKHRGSRELIKSRLRVYEDLLHTLRRLSPKPLAIDLGCGRGEWLELLRATGFEGQGVDLDEGMLQASRDRGLQVVKADALAALNEMADESLTLVTAFHLIEHMSFDDLRILTAVALQKLIPGGLLILETPNPENLVVGTADFFLDPTHVKPIPPQLLAFVAEYAGFQRHMIMRLQESAALRDASKIDLFSVLDGVSPDYALVAQKLGSEDTTAPFDAAFARHYGLSLRSLAAKYDAAITEDLRQGQESIKQVHTAVGEVEKQADLLRTQVVALGRQLQDATRRAEWLERHAAGTEIRFSDLHLRQSNAEASFHHAMNNMEQARIAEQHNIERVHLAEQRLRDAEYRIQAIYASTSWRVTSPLRAVGSLVRNWRGGVAASKLATTPGVDSQAPPLREHVVPGVDAAAALAMQAEPVQVPPPAPSTLNELPEDTRTILRQLGVQSKDWGGGAQ